MSEMSCVRLNRSTWLILVVLASLIAWHGKAAELGGAFSKDRERGATLARDYFPPPVFADLTDYDEWVKAFAALHLSQMNEPVLLREKAINFALRVTWMSSFQGDAVLRIERKDSGEVLSVFKRYPPGSDPNTIAAMPAATAERMITGEGFARLLDKVRDVDFFSLDNKQTTISSDGVECIVEVYDHGRYHAVYRTGYSNPVRDVARLSASIAQVTADVMN